MDFIRSFIGLFHRAKSVLVLVLIFLVIPFGDRVSAENAANGIEGGYVGSDQWFVMMRKSAENWALYKALSGSADYRKLPGDYIELAGMILFPGGNPFPDKRIPDLRIRCRNLLADTVERAPRLDKQGGFYTVLKKGQIYDFYWLSNSGTREIFKSVTVNRDGMKQRKATFEYNLRKLAPVGTFPSPNPSPAPAKIQMQPENAATPEDLPLSENDQFDLSEFPAQPENFDAQLIDDAMRAAQTPLMKAFAHQMLGDYYFKRGDSAKAEAEYLKAKYWRTLANQGGQ